MAICGGIALARLGSVHTFCFFCLLGALAFILVGVVGWESAEHKDRREGVCSITDPAVFACECAEWENTGNGERCAAYEAYYTNVTFTLNSDERSIPSTDTATTTSSFCPLKLGAGSITSCVETTISFTSDTTTCYLHDDTRSCFVVDSMGDNGKESYWRLWVGGVVWGAVVCCCSVALLLHQVHWRRARHKRLLEDDTPPSDDELPGHRNGAFLKNDPVSVSVQGNWSNGAVQSRDGNGTYTVNIEGRTYEVPKDHIRSAAFKEGTWVTIPTTINNVATTSGVTTLRAGILGVVTSDEDSALEVAVGGTIFNPTPGQVVPSPSVRKGHIVEVSTSADGEWEEGVVRSVIGDGILLVSKGGAVPKSFHWARRPHGVQIEALPVPAEMEVPSHFVFVDPDSGVAPTVMTNEQVELYGGVRKIAKELSESRAAPAGKLMMSAGMLGAATLVTKHLEREERAHTTNTAAIVPPAAPCPSAVQSPSQPHHVVSAAPSLSCTPYLGTTPLPYGQGGTPSLHPLMPTADDVSQP